MKKLLISTLVVVLVVVASTLVVQHYKNYQNKKSQEAAVQAKNKADEIASIRNQAKINEDAYKIQIEKLTVECVKGVKAYETLTVSQRAKVASPVCQP